mgnify:CR=1 FL=1
MARPKKRGARRWFFRLLTVGAAASAVLAAWTWFTWPDVAALASKDPGSSAFIDVARAERDDVEWRWMPSSEISLELKKAVIAAEDLSFFSHSGFDTHELKIAARDAVRGKRVRGASTITQQLAKNLWLSPSRSPFRKIREAILTRQLETHLSKGRILELYLNLVQFGPAVYGAEAAARHYFGRSAADLDAEQAAALAASLPRPAPWHPGVETRGYALAVDRIRDRVERCDGLDKLL